MTLNLKTTNQSSCMTLWPMMLHHHTKFGYRRSAAEELWSRWMLTGILNLFCDLDLDHNRAIQSFHKTIHLMMMCHQTKFSCKRISNIYIYIKKAYFDYIIHNCDLDLEDSKPIFLKDNLIMIITIPSLVVKDSVFKKVSSGQTFTDILKFCCDLDLEHDNPASP